MSADLAVLDVEEVVGTPFREDARSPLLTCVTLPRGGASTSLVRDDFELGIERVGESTARIKLLRMCSDMSLIVEARERWTTNAMVRAMTEVVERSDVSVEMNLPLRDRDSEVVVEVAVYLR